MKRYSIALILAVFAVIIVTLTACGNKKGTDEPSTEPVPTVVGDNGVIYEEVTEIHTEIITENVEVTNESGEKETETVINTVPVTKKGGEKVTKKGGEVETQTQVETQVVTEVRTEVRTEVVTQTVPYTTGADENNSTEAASTTSVAEVTYAAGTPVQVPLNSEGNPEEPLVNEVFEAVKKKKQLALTCTIVTDEDTGLSTNEIPNSLYVKGDNMAYEVKIGAMKVKIISKGGSTSIVFPGAKAYYTAAGDSAATDIKELDIWDTFTNEGMEYVGTTRVNALTCEEYKSGEASMKYYFDNSNNLKRIEINDGGSVTIMKIDTIRTTVSDSEFEIPKGYTKLSEEKFESLLGSLGAN